jgi:uncharacterized protein
MNQNSNRYPTREECLKILRDVGCPEQVIEHVLVVTKLALLISNRFIEIGTEVDMELIEAGGLLHDIGRAKTHGVTHAIEGSKLAQKLELPNEIVKIIERHIGAGILEDDAKELGLPIKDYSPQSLEERIISHADNLVEHNKRVKIRRSIEILNSKGLPEVAERIRQLHIALSSEAGIDIDKL